MPSSWPERVSELLKLGKYVLSTSGTFDIKKPRVPCEESAWYHCPVRSRCKKVPCGLHGTNSYACLQIRGIKCFRFFFYYFILFNLTDHIILILFCNKYEVNKKKKKKKEREKKQTLKILAMFIGYPLNLLKS